MINAITCSLLESSSTSDDYEMNTGVYKSKHSKPTIKHFMKETRLGHRAACNLVNRVYNIRAKYP